MDDMTEGEMTRRAFLSRSLVGAGAVSVGSFGLDLLEPETEKHPSDRILLGPENVEVSRMAMGTGTSGVGGSSNQTEKLGVEGLSRLLQKGVERGITFWDSADQYGSHPHLRAALGHVPREDVQILTKTHASTEAEMESDLDRFRKELGTDYIDVVLLHALQDKNWPDKKRGAMRILSRARENGIVRTHGVSCHSIEALKTAANTPWVQVDLARINPYGVRMDADVPTVVSVLKDMKKFGKGVIGMKLLGAGQLVPHIDECLKYAVDSDFVDCFTIGVESEEQLADLSDRIPAVSRG